MPEPVVLMQRCVCLRRPPAKVSVAVKAIPVLIGNDPIFISCPADISILEQRSISKHERVRLLDAKGLDDTWKIVDMALAASAIQPEFNQIAVLGGQLIELRDVVVVVLSGI